MSQENKDSETRLLVQVGDVIAKGEGDQMSVAVISWTNRAYSHTPPVDAVCLVSPVGDDRTGMAMDSAFLDYLGAFEYSEAEIAAVEETDDEFSTREGHTWAVNKQGWSHVSHPWWKVFREQ